MSAWDLILCVGFFCTGTRAFFGVFRQISRAHDRFWTDKIDFPTFIGAVIAILAGAAFQVFVAVVGFTAAYAGRI